MKRLISILAALALCLCLAIPAAAVVDAQSAGLKFKEDGTFKIIHVTDTQDFFLSCRITQEFLYDLAKAEKPNLFVLTGDNISSSGAKNLPKFLAKLLVKCSVDNLMRAFDKIYRDFGIPVTMVFGNHDNEVGPDKVTRAEQFEMYKAHKSFIGYYIPAADEGTEDDQGQHYGTHNIIVKEKTRAAPAFNLWMFDSGSYDPVAGGYSCVQPAQIAWFNTTNTALGKLPSFAFQHIIVKEINGLLTADQKLPAGTPGELRESPCPSKGNHGQFDALSAGGVLALFVGHDHTNTFEFRGMPGKTDLVNSPCTGFGSYGDADLRGARVITLQEDMTYDTGIVTFQAFYPENTLRGARLGMYQLMSTPATLLDWLSFAPLLCLLGLFGVKV